MTLSVRANGGQPAQLKHRENLFRFRSPLFVRFGRVYLMHFSSPVQGDAPRTT